MKYALVNGKDVEASKGVKGVCRVCGLELIAKCGEWKIHHWAHKTARTCDSWWERETEWHRSWKNKFPENWQERILFDEQSGEKHIADIKTSHGLVIEFQHSFINHEERFSREKFYKNLLWVVDGTRLKHDYPRFAKKKGSFPEVRKGIFRVDSPDECFPSAWLNSSVPVVFDFFSNKPTSELKENPQIILYCLFPVKIKGTVFVAAFTRTAFVNTVISGEWSERAARIISQLLKERELQTMKEQPHRTLLNIQELQSRRPIRRHRRM